MQALVQAEISTPGKADSFLQATHVVRTRRAHQVTLAALYILKHRAYSNYCQQDEMLLEFKEWSAMREIASTLFKYWTIVMELSILVFVRSLRQRSFAMYLDALTELVPWFHALDHTNYARWIPIHLRDMTELPTRHPEIATIFDNGNFVVCKTGKAFSAIPIDQAHEQNNALIKGDGGAVGLTENPSALRRWMVAGPEVARVVEEFHSDQDHRFRSTKHHDQTPSVQAAFAKDVQYPFEEESSDLFTLDTKQIANSAAIETVRNAKKIGLEQFQAFTKDYLMDRTKAIDSIIHRNKLLLFGCDRKAKLS